MSDERPVLVRPRGGQLDPRLTDLLVEARVDLANLQTIAQGMPDMLALLETTKRRINILIVPFHPHADMQGNDVNGLEFCRRLIGANPSVHHVPIVMPVSTGSKSTLRLKATLGETATAYAELLDTQILLIFEDELSDPALLPKLTDHLEKKREARSQTSGVFDLPRRP